MIHEHSIIQYFVRSHSRIQLILGSLRFLREHCQTCTQLKVLAVLKLFRGFLESPSEEPNATESGKVT